MAKQIKIGDVIKHSYKFSSVALFSKILGFPKSIVLAMILVPSDYGKVGIIMLYISYIGFLNLGNVNAAFRELPGLIKTKRIDEATYVQNNAFSFDILIKVFFLISLLIFASIQNDIELKLLYGLFAIWFFLSKIQYYQNIQNLSRMDFGFAAKINLIDAIVNFVLSISLVFFIGIYALVVPLIIGQLVVILYQYRKKGNRGFKFQISKKEIIRTSKIGIPLILLSFLYKAFESITSKTLIVKYLTEEDLGLFVFALSIVILGTQLLKDISNVYRPMLWGNADTVKEMKDAFSSVREITQATALFSGIIIGLAQIGFVFMVNMITPNFKNAQWIFLILSLSIFLVGVQGPAEFVLTSRRINKQKITTIIWVFALLINILLGIGAIKLGYGIIGVSVTLVISQLLATYMMFGTASKYVFIDEPLIKKFYFFIRLTLPLILGIVILLFHWFFTERLPMAHLIIFSFLLQFIIWFSFGFIFYKEQLKLVSKWIVTLKSQLINKMKFS